MILDFSQPKEKILAQFDLNEAWQEPIFSFLKNWLDDSMPEFSISTSGSTGSPKTITHSRFRMIESAKRTNTFFSLDKNSVLLLALPVRAIGGRMMLVRAQIAACKIVCVEPSALPFTSASLSEQFTFDFAAFTPMQVFEMLKNEQTKIDFSHIQNVIIGGGKISDELQEKLRELPNNIYETFGMTETVSHIALRKISEKEFTCLPEISVKKDDLSRLLIELPNNEILQTNDIVELSDSKHFTWLSRIDDVINTGGIKVFANEIEAKLKPHISIPFFIAKMPDEKFGEKVVLVVEQNAEKDTFFLDLFAHVLSPYEKPKTILRPPKFIYSEMGKLMKQATLQNTIR
ncbi:MAG TPA: AMP-binding protein [Chitinophagales bacterium]